MVLQYTLFDCINNINHFYTPQLQVITDSYSVCYMHVPENAHHNCRGPTPVGVDLNPQNLVVPVAVLQPGSLG